MSAVETASQDVLKPNGKGAACDPVAVNAGTWAHVFTKPGVHPFDEIEWKTVDASIVGPSGKKVFEAKNIEVPSWWETNTINIVADKYFRMINGVKETSVKQVFTRVASTIRKWAYEQGYFNTKEDAHIYEMELIYSLLHQYGAFNSPVWFNLGVPGRRQAASACFISSVDDTLDSILDFQKSESVIFAGGSGSGANLSKIRSSYEKLTSGSYTSGPLSWMRGLDQYAMAMKSGGSTRNAAKMVVLDMDHPDILETKDGRPGFIRCKSEEEKLAHLLVNNGISSAYDDPNGAYKRVMYQNANHSISIPDAFMRAVVEDSDWVTKERITGKAVHTYKARDVWAEVSKAAWVCGDPGVQFSDTINRWHTIPKTGPIVASNPCSEYLNVDDSACNLCALNLTKFFNGRRFNYDRFAHATRVFSMAQMAIVDKADYPTEKIKNNSRKLRPIGTNYGDLGALLMKLGYAYDSNEGRVVAARLASLMTGLVYKTAAGIAARVGAFEDFEKNRSEMMNVMKMHQDADRDIINRWSVSSDPLGSDVISKSAEVWKEAIELGHKYGYSICQATLQAPLGTISFLMGMDTTGIEPAFSLVSYKSMVGGGFMKIVNGAVREAFSNLGLSSEKIADVVKYVEDTGSVEGAPHVDPSLYPVFETAMPSGPSGKCITPLGHIKMMAAIQPLITCAQSKTVNLPSTATPEEIGDIYLESWKLGVKCVALYRDGCKASQPLATKERAAEEGNLKSDVKKTPEVSAPAVVANDAIADNTPVLGSAGHNAQRRRMPDDVRGWRHKFDLDGYKGYIIVNEYEDGTPGEVFLKLGKPGSTVAGLIDGFTKLLSTSLQHGIPLERLIASFIETRFEPSGMTSNPKVRFAKSLYDYLFKLLDVHYYGGRISGLDYRLQAMNEPASYQDEISREPKSSAGSSIEVKQAKNIDAPPCPRCGTLTQRSGSCYLCVSCGSSTGCS